MAQHAVLVTGGSGFLGQHIVKHIDMYMKEVTEIRVLDCEPYKKNLDYDATTPVKTFVGSITDKQLLKTSCKGVKCVFHIAAMVDIRMFPDVKRMNEINVNGTELLMNICQEENVEYLIYCGSNACFLHGKDVLDGTETTVPFIDKCKISDYHESKRKALCLVLKKNGCKLKNGRSFKTIAILPPGMYGEQNRLMLDFQLKMKEGIQYRVFGKSEALQQFIYAGNMAILFVQAYKSLQNNSDLGGQYFFASDDTPNQTLIAIRHICLPGDSPDVTPSSWYIPEVVCAMMFCVIYYVLVFLRLFVNINFPISPKILLNSTNKSYCVRSDKAKTLLGYQPIYDYKTAVMKTKSYFYSLRQHVL